MWRDCVVSYPQLLSLSKSELLGLLQKQANFTLVNPLQPRRMECGIIISDLCPLMDVSVARHSRTRTRLTVRPCSKNTYHVN